MAFAVPTFILAFAAIVSAWFYGGKPERAGAGILLAMLLLTYTGHAIFPRIFHTVDPVGLTVDLVGFVGFSAIGISSRRVWPLWAASLQLLSSGAHFVRALSIPVEPRVYFWMKTSPTWLVMILLIAGTLAYRRRLKLSASASSSQG
jgi:hypothetical protein